MFVSAELIEAHAPAEVDDKKPRASATLAGPGAIYTIQPEKRVELDTTKNILIHFFVERSLVATALLSAPTVPAPVDAVRQRVQALSRLFKFEFRFRADASFDEIFSDTVTTMEEAREVVERDGQLAPGPGRAGWTGHEWLSTYAAFLQNFIESYRVAARGLGALVKGPLAEKDLVKKALATGQRMFFSGEIERSESVSQPNVKNAFAVFGDLGHVTTREGRLQLTDPRPEAVRAIEADIATYLQTEVAL